MELDKSYSEMLTFKAYGDRLAYLCVAGKQHVSPRSISEKFYKTDVWKQTRKTIIRRDLGFDLGATDMDIEDTIIVHHINPITEEDILNWSPKLLDPENLITTSLTTHNHIHYGIPVETEEVVRTPGDTSLW